MDDIFENYIFLSKFQGEEWVKQFHFRKSNDCSPVKEASQMWKTQQYCEFYTNILDWVNAKWVLNCFSSIEKKKGGRY
jgi:hypothetical protein